MGSLYFKLFPNKLTQISDMLINDIDLVKDETTTQGVYTAVFIEMSNVDIIPAVCGKLFFKNTLKF